MIFLEENVDFHDDIGYRNKETLASKMKQHIYYKGKYAAMARAVNDRIFFIVEGELMVYHNKVNLVKLVRGSYFGEESVLFGKRFLYDIVVASDVSKIYSLKKKYFLKIFPKTIVENMKENFKLKVNNRKNL